MTSLLRAIQSAIKADMHTWAATLIGDYVDTVLEGLRS